MSESKSMLGDENIQKQMLYIFLDCQLSLDPIIRCAAGEAIARMALILSKTNFMNDIVSLCVEK